MVGDHSRQMKNSLITYPPNCWAPVPLSRKFQFLAHFPFPAKFIGRIRERIVAIIRYIWDGRQEVKAPIVWDFPDEWKPGLRLSEFLMYNGSLFHSLLAINENDLSIHYGVNIRLYQVTPPLPFGKF